MKDESETLSYLTGGLRVVIWSPTGSSALVPPLLARHQKKKKNKITRLYINARPVLDKQWGKRENHSL